MQDQANVGVGGSEATASTSKVGIVKQQLNMAVNEAENLTKVVEGLSTKLVPVLGITPPPSDSETKSDGAREELPLLADSIRSVRYSVMGSIKKLQHLCNRIEL